MLLKMKKIAVDASIWQILLLGFIMSQCCCSSAAEEIKCSKPADIYFVLDASASIWGPDFKKQLAFVKSVIAELELDPNVVRCGLITYGDIVRHEFGLAKYAGRKKAIEAAVTSIRQVRGETRTDKALQRMRELMQAEAREGVPRIAIVMTDGQSDYPKLTNHEAQLAHKMGITTFAIGIGSKVDERELQALASHEEYLFTVDSFDALAAVKILLSEKACEVKFVPPPVRIEVQHIEGCKYEPADIVFVLDASSSVFGSDFSRLLSFVEDLVHVMSISSEDVRFGVLTFGNTPKEQIQLDQFSTTSDLTRAISQIVQQRGGSNTAAALQYLREHAFTGTRRREGAEKIAILVTDGPSDNPALTTRQARLVHQEGIRVFAVGVGKGAPVKELETMGSQPSEENVFAVDGYDALGNIMAVMASKTCKLVDKEALDRGDDIVWNGRKTTMESTTTSTSALPETIKPATTKPTTTKTTPTTPKATPTTTTTRPTTAKTTPATTTATPTAKATPRPPPIGCGEVKPADIVFALPSTANSHQTNEALGFIRSVADRMRVSPKGVRMGLAPRNCASVPGFTLDQGSDRNQVLKMFDTRQKATSPAAETDATIKYLRNVSFRPESGARPNARKIGVLIVDRAMKNFPKAVDESILAKRDDIDLVVIGVGKEVSVDELTMLAGTRGRYHSVMTVPCYAQLRKLTRKLAFTADRFCAAH